MHENAKNALGYTLLPIIMEVENGSLQYYFSFLSFGVIFYFHGRKGTYRYLLFRLISNASAPTTGLTGTGWKLHTRMFDDTAQEKTPEKNESAEKKWWLISRSLKIFS